MNPASLPQSSRIYLKWGVSNFLASLLVQVDPLIRVNTEFQLLIALRSLLLPGALFGLLLILLAATVLHGSLKMAVVLVFSAWAGLGTGLMVLSTTEAWQRDDGLGVGFTLLFTCMYALGYLALVFIFFVLWQIGLRIQRFWIERRLPR